MPKSLSTFTPDEMTALKAKLAKVYADNGHPEWLSHPKFYTECVNILNAGAQQKQLVLQIEGAAPLTDKDKAAKIKQELDEATAEVVEKEIEVGCSYGVGSKMGVIEAADKVYINGEAAEGRAEVKHEPGQVLLLDFWATWCPPCQKPMAHNQEMLDKRGSDWGANVRLIGLSIDQDKQKLINHVKDKGWTKVEHYHVRNGSCTADKEYGVQGVPHVLLVDKEGTIVFMGHPSSQNIEECIDKLLKGEKLSGEGTQAKGASADKAEDSDKKPVLDEDIEKFAADTKAWVEADMKSKCEGMQRAFLVMTNDCVLNVKDNSSKNKATVHTVLVGPKAKVDELKTECEKFNKGNWDNRDQIIPQ